MKAELENNFKTVLETQFMATIRNEDWPHFLWNVSLKTSKGFVHFPYKMGLGHVYKSKFRGMPDRPKAPTIQDVLYGLLMDSQASAMSFNDWCSEFGYSNDSMSCFKTYQACCESAEKLNKLYSKQEINEIKEALADY